jgi:hypothetical protein
MKSRVGTLEQAGNKRVELKERLKYLRKAIKGDSKNQNPHADKVAASSAYTSRSSC